MDSIRLLRTRAGWSQRELAERLGVTCYDKFIIGQTAKEAGLSAETVESDEEKPIGLCEVVSGNPFADSALLGATF